MAYATPSPLPDASATDRGAVSTVAQTWVGVKTFTDGLISKKVKLSGLSTGAVGFEASAPDTTNDKAFVFNNTIALTTGNAMLAEWQNAGTKIMGLTYYGRLQIEDIKYITGGWRIYGGTYFAIEASGGAACVTVSDVTLQLTAPYGINSGGNLNGAGNLVLEQGDSTAAPGNTTINVAHGRAAIALGQSTVRVTTNFIDAASHTVLITPIDRDATCKELICVVSNGYFDVSGTANATADLKFMFAVIKKR